MPGDKQSNADEMFLKAYEAADEANRMANAYTDKHPAMQTATELVLITYRIASASFMAASAAATYCRELRVELQGLRAELKQRAVTTEGE